MRVLSGFGWRSGRLHTGIDLRSAPRGGDPVFAARGGVVAAIGTRGGYGRMVLMKHDDGSFTRYAHLRSFSVRPGDRLAAGQRLGRVGATGRASGPHLHFEILSPDRRPLDPAPFLRLR